MKDLKGFIPHQLDDEDLEGLTEEEEAELWAARGMQASCIRRFLGMEKGYPSKPKSYRLATWRLIQALDHALFQLTKAGLEQLASSQTKVDFLQPEVRARVEAFATGPPRAVFLAADQASCGLSACAFLQQSHQQLFFDLLMDPHTGFGTVRSWGCWRGMLGRPSSSPASPTLSTTDPGLPQASSSWCSRPSAST